MVSAVWTSYETSACSSLAVSSRTSLEPAAAAASLRVSHTANGYVPHAVTGTTALMQFTATTWASWSRARSQAVASAASLHDPASAGRRMLLIMAALRNRQSLHPIPALAGPD